MRFTHVLRSHSEGTPSDAAVTRFHFYIDNEKNTNGKTFSIHTFAISSSESVPMAHNRPPRYTRCSTTRVIRFCGGGPCQPRPRV